MRMMRWMWRYRWSYQSIRIIAITQTAFTRACTQTVLFWMHTAISSLWAHDATAFPPNYKNRLAFVVCICALSPISPVQNDDASLMTSNVTCHRLSCKSLFYTMRWKKKILNTMRNIINGSNSGNNKKLNRTKSVKWLIAMRLICQCLSMCTHTDTFMCIYYMCYVVLQNWPLLPLLLLLIIRSVSLSPRQFGLRARTPEKRHRSKWEKKLLKRMIKKNVIFKVQKSIVCWMTEWV